MEEKDAFLLKNRRHVSTQRRGGLLRPPLLPIYESLPKEHVIVGDGGIGAPKFATCACGRGKPKRKFSLRFGEEETSSEDKKYRFAILRSVKRPERRLGLRSGKEETTLRE